LGYSKLEGFEIETELEKEIKFIKYDGPKRQPKRRLKNAKGAKTKDVDESDNAGEGRARIEE